MTTRRSANHPFCCALLLAAMLASCRPAVDVGRLPEQPGLNAGFARMPPDVDSMWVRLLDPPAPEGNALLHVRFSPEERLGRTIIIRPGERMVVLRDDGLRGDALADDRTYSTFVDFPTEQFAAGQERLERYAAAGGRVPVFTGRELAAHTRPRFVAREHIRAGSTFVLTVPQGIATTVDPDRSLLIRNSQVLTDPQRTWDPCTRTGNTMGAWSFPYLVTQIANQIATGLPAGLVMERWLADWAAGGQVNGWIVAGRTPPAGLTTAMDSANGWGLSQLPFKLVAIVSRVDLRGNGAYGGGTGEGRFIFQAVDPAQNCAPLPFTIILEYSLPGLGCNEAQARAAEWIALSTHTNFGAGYRTALAAVTHGFTQAGARADRPPNRSALNQLRTNELSPGLLTWFTMPHWDMREFDVAGAGSSDPGYLLASTVAQTPGRTVDQAVLAAYMQSLAGPILNDKYELPLSIQGTPIRGGAAPAQHETFYWNVQPSPVIPGLRHKFSLNTCNGCHTAETATRFLHVSSGFANPATPPVSGFLTGIQVTDPETGITRNFNDLLRRQQDLSALVNSVCLQQLHFKVLPSPH
ncbi:MAG TPA: hypothetical protein VE871_11235 [Longimicrobium sp.]|nr:hypothetical protein [Longimicrobium sp.]